MNTFSFLRIISFSILLSGACLAFAQAEAPTNTDTPPIQDNSFLIEEAYNQENGVVQHIQTFTRLWPGGGWAYTFTQEFPAHGLKHQLSYTLQASHSGDYLDSGAGLGDVAFNYRYQLVGSGQSRVAVSPRFTVLAPTGSVRMGRGAGGAGVQVQIPVSFQISRHFVTHSNIGATWIPRAQNQFGERASANGYNLGQSFIWLAKPRFNVLVETLWTGTESVITRDKTQRSHDMFVSPGIRWAHNFKSGLQIVPGIGVPIGVGPSAGDKGIFVYLSFEHPWKAFKSARE